MWLKLITCEVLARSVYMLAAKSRNIVDVELIEKGLHTYPDQLRDELQRRIDACDEVGYEAILLGYGLCCNSTAGLLARKTQLVIPRAHDCITLYMGDRKKYQEQFISHPGTYYYTTDYMERSRLRPGENSLVPLGSGDENKVKQTYAEYVEKYGQDNADYLMEVMGAWKEHYDRAVFIDMGVGDGVSCELQAREETERRGWSFECVPGDSALLERMIEGDWGDDFLVVEPGGKVVPAYDEGILDWVEVEEDVSTVPSRG